MVSTRIDLSLLALIMELAYIEEKPPTMHMKSPQVVTSDSEEIHASARKPKVIMIHNDTKTDYIQFISRQDKAWLMPKPYKIRHSYGGNRNMTELLDLETSQAQIGLLKKAKLSLQRF
jgi:hypothetical protein